jgi:ketosteroid isomerase-like protein
MTQENLAIVRDLYAATNERDFRRAMSHYAEDVELVVPPGSTILAGTFNGRDQIGRWFGDWFATFDKDARFEIEELIEVDDSSVLLIATHRARGRASGAEVAGDVLWLYRLRDGKIEYVRGYDARSEALEAAGL